MSIKTSAAPKPKVKPRTRYAWISANCTHDFKEKIRVARGGEPEAPFVIRMIQAGLDATTFNGEALAKKTTVVTQIPAKKNGMGGKAR